MLFSAGLGLGVAAVVALALAVFLPRTSRRPWLGVLTWIGAVIFVRTLVDAYVLDQGLWDTWRCPLGKGYRLEFVDEPNCGSILAPPGSDKPSIAVCSLQVGSAWIAGSRRQAENETFFLLDTESGAVREFLTEAGLRKAAGADIRLEPIERVHRRNRVTWFDWVSVLAAVAPGALLLFRFRRQRDSG